MRIKKTEITELTIIFSISLMFSLLFHELTNDDIWNYGFAYNISNGLVPYRDFNMVTTPLYPLIDAVFLIIFGKNIITHYIVNAVVLTIIFIFMKQNYSKIYYIPFAILLLFSSPNYNIICLLFIYVLLYLEKNSKNDYLIGIVLGLTFLTKQSIGIYLCVPSVFKKNIKIIIKRIIGFLIPNILIIIYLILNHALYNFIDYCFLGIREFSNKNFLLLPLPAIILIISIGYLIYEYIKNKDIKLIYLLCLFGMSYPITDPYHVMIPFIPTFAYFLDKLKLNKKIINIAFLFFVVGFSIYNIYSYSSKGNYSFPNNTNTFKYCKIDNNSDKDINTLTKYYKNSDKNTFVIDSSGYLLKLETGRQIGKYDFFLTGNVGKNGSYRIIKDFDKICQKEKCTFILNQYSYDSLVYSQYNRIIHEYVVSNYKEVDKVVNLTVYNNH